MCVRGDVAHVACLEQDGGVAIVVEQRGSAGCLGLGTSDGINLMASKRSRPMRGGCMLAARQRGGARVREAALQWEDEAEADKGLGGQTSYRRGVRGVDGTTKCGWWAK